MFWYTMSEGLSTTAPPPGAATTAKQSLGRRLAVQRTGCCLRCERTERARSSHVSLRSCSEPAHVCALSQRTRHTASALQRWHFLSEGVWVLDVTVRNRFT